MRFFLIFLTVFCFAALSRAQAGPPSGIYVITDIAPIRALVNSVAGQGVRVEQIVPDGFSPHEFALKPSQLRALQAADLIVWLGPVATPGLAKMMAASPFSEKAITLNQLKNTQLLAMRSAGVYTRTGASDANTLQRVYDPHSWLDPQNAVFWVHEISRALGALEPASTTKFQRNAKVEIDRIQAAASQIRRRLDAASLRPFVQFHDAFQYFENRFELSPLGLATTGGAEATSLGVTAALRSALSGTEPACVFSTNDQQSARAAMLLDIDGVTEGRIDPLGRDIPPEQFDYPALLVSVADGFVACLAS